MNLLLVSLYLTVAFEVEGGSNWAEAEIDTSNGTGPHPS